MSDVQYAEDIFPEKQGFADDLFPASVDTEIARKKLGASPVQDYIFSRDNVSVGRVLSHFGQGFKDGWGHDGMTVTKETADYMRKSGWFGDYEDGQVTLTKAANEALFRPAAVALVGTVEGAFRLMSGTFRGAQEVVAATSADLGQPQLGRDLAAIPEAFPHPRPIAGSLGLPQVVHGKGLAATPAGIAESGEALLLRARAAKVIGHGEEGWRGTEAPKAEAPRAIPEGSSAIERTFADAEGASPIEQMLASPPEAAPIADVHTTARGIAPDLFYRYDEAQTQRQTLAGQLSELETMRARDAAMAQEIADLKAKVTEKLQAATTEARELAPAVKEAYAEAKKVTTPEPDVTTPVAGYGKDAEISSENVTTPGADVTKPARPIEEQRAFIQQDVAEKLVAAGRSESEAQAAAAIDAAYWETRAERFKGAKGTAEEMYRREGPEILGPGMQSDYRTVSKPRVQRMSLGQFVSSIGVRDNDPMIGDIKSITGGGKKFIRKDGVPLDRLREMAAEQGYIPKDSKISTLLDALRNEDKGNKVYKPGEEVGTAFDREGHLNAIERALDDSLRDVGLDPKTIPDEVRARAIEIMDKEHVTDPITAYEKAESEAGMFQGADSIKRGRIRLREDGRNTITLLKEANASTFIHEKGHDYLSRMIRDAADEAAPIELRTDAETVFKWLGVEKASDIKTSHHEKFARGFENYIMEGRAPSHALARVFEQFRQWLLRIYTEASRLKAPINDEIRGVFDRMLAVEPEQVVIAPDRAPEAIAKRFEASVETTPAPAAADLAGTVEAERDRLAAGLPPGKQDARLAEIRAEIEGRAPRGAQPDGDGNVAGLASERPGAGGESAAAGAGGSETAPQASGVVSAKPSGPSVRTEPPASPTAPFARDTGVDKAGNIRLDLLATPDDVKNIISQVADENAEFQKVRGPVTDIQVAELADAMGMDATYLSTRKLGEAWTAPQIVALRNLLIQSATEVRDVMRKAASGNEADLLAYAEVKQRHLMIQERVHSVTAEAGRALRAFQGKFTGMGDAKALGDFLKKETGQTLFQLEREVKLGMSLETPSQVSKFIHDSRKATVSEMIQETWINALLSGPITHVKNIIGNTGVAVLNVAETAATAGVGKVREVLGNKGERATLGEARANLFGLVQGAQDGLIAGKYAFLHEEQYTRAQTLEQGKFQAVPSKRIVVAKYEQGSPQYNARIEAFANARARAERLTGERLAARVEGLKTSPTPDMVLDATEKAIEIGGKQIRTPGRMLTAEDEFFKTIAYRQKLNELAYRQAAKEGLSGDAFNTRMARLTMDPPEEMMTAATKHADYQTFTNTLGKTGIALQQFSNSHLLAKMVVPFIRTPLNLLKYANERTPLGVFSREVRANLTGVNGKIAQDTQIARMAIGTSLAVTTMYLADQGYITGGGPSDKNEKATLMLSGWRPYSIKIGDTYYSYGWLDPYSTIMGISADLADTVKKLGDDNGDEISKIATNLFASISKNILSKSSLRGASDILQAVTDPDRWGARYLQNLAGTVVPSVVAQQARAHDEFQREARTVLDSLKSRIPGLRPTLMPKRDIWGEPIAQGKNLGPDSMSPIAMSKLTKDPATQALIEAELFPAKLDRKIRGVELTDQQYDDYARVAGRMAKVRVNAIVSNPGFSNAPVEIRSDILKKAVQGSREAARSMIMMQNPDIIRQALGNKMSAVGR